MQQSQRWHSRWGLRSLLTAGTAAAALGLAACGGGDSSSPTSPGAADATTASTSGSGAEAGGGGQLAFTRLDTTSPTFGPTSQNTGNDALVNSLLFSNLVKVEPDENTLKPDLAESWEVSEDAKTFTFQLREDVKWSDGTPFTAKDVVFTINQAAQFGVEPYSGYQPTQWREIVGAEDVEETTDPVRGVKALDDHTVQIKLVKPNSEFVRNLTDAVYSIVPEHLLADTTVKSIKTDEFTRSKPVGTGPYTLAKYVPNQYIEFKANADYFGGAPKIDPLFFKLGVKPETAVAQLESGELDVVFNLPPTAADRLQGSEAITVEKVVAPAGEFLQFRTDHPQVEDPRVRQAIYYAVDRRAMLENLFDGNGEIRWVIPGFDQDDPALDQYPYDPEKAKQLLSEAGFDGSKPFKFLYAGADVDPLWPQMAPVIQKYLKDVGINAVLDPVDAAKWTEQLSDPEPTFPMTLQSGGTGGLSPDRFSGAFNCKAPLATFYANCELDELYVAGRSTTDPAERDAIYAKIAAILNEDVPYGTLWQATTIEAYTNRLGGTFKVYPSDRDSFFGIAGWTLSE